MANQTLKPAAFSGRKKRKRNSTRMQRASGNKKSARGGSTLLSSLVKALIYIVVILIVSVFAAYFVISRANDAFAFVKDGAEATVVIDDGISVDELASELKSKGIIKYPSMFRLYVKIKGKSTDYVGGEYVLNPSMNYDKIIRTLARSTEVDRTTVVAVIPEGYTVTQIVNRLVKNYGLSSEQELYTAIQSYPFDFWFVKELDNLPADSKYRTARTFRLEGYLYPDTYYFFSDASAETIIYKMLNNFESKLKVVFGDDYRETITRLCAERGHTFDELIILASMVQMEGKYDYDYGVISSIFHNRLNNPARETYGFLGSDATIQYILSKRVGAFDLTDEDLNTDSPYNTRRYKGLPPGPISNPTYLAIHYSFYPDETNYYYFVSQADGTTVPARTLEEHQANVEKVRAGIYIDLNASDE
ncbi:MAG: endolytic transglycosylase MltG [Clostridia bacterium]|nr:endolytic transglycosylase MltG [Clostridia bacterium]